MAVVGVVGVGLVGVVGVGVVGVVVGRVYWVSCLPDISRNFSHDTSEVWYTRELLFACLR